MSPYKKNIYFLFYSDAFDSFQDTELKFGTEVWITYVIVINYRGLAGRPHRGAVLSDINYLDNFYQ